MHLTGLTWGNLSPPLRELEEAGWVAIEKGYKGRKPSSMIRFSDEGRAAFREYKNRMQQVLGDLPD